MSIDVGEKSRFDSEALLEAVVERFLKNGIRESNLDGCCGGVGGAEESKDMELSLDSDPKDVSDPV
jgi:hypothetical protein